MHIFEDFTKYSGILKNKIRKYWTKVYIEHILHIFIYKYSSFLFNWNYLLSVIHRYHSSSVMFTLAKQHSKKVQLSEFTIVGQVGLACLWYYASAAQQSNLWLSADFDMSTRTTQLCTHSHAGRMSSSELRSIVRPVAILNDYISKYTYMYMCMYMYMRLSGQMWSESSIMGALNTRPATVKSKQKLFRFTSGLKRSLHALLRPQAECVEQRDSLVLPEVASLQWKHGSSFPQQTIFVKSSFC